MWALFEILEFSSDNLLWGVLIAVIFIALFFILIKGWYKNATFSPISYIVGVILFLLLSFQCILIIGSLRIISLIDFYEEQITTIVDELVIATSYVSAHQSDEIVKRLIEEYPVLHYYISGGNFTGYTASELPQAIAEEMRSYMRWYIFRRVLWCVGFILVCAFCVIKSMPKNRTNSPSNLKRAINYDNF